MTELVTGQPPGPPPHSVGAHSLAPSVQPWSIALCWTLSLLISRDFSQVLLVVHVSRGGALLIRRKTQVSRESYELLRVSKYFSEQTQDCLQGPGADFK